MTTMRCDARCGSTSHVLNEGNVSYSGAVSLCGKTSGITIKIRFAACARESFPNFGTHTYAAFAKIVKPAGVLVHLDLGRNFENLIITKAEQKKAKIRICIYKIAHYEREINSKYCAY